MSAGNWIDRERLFNKKCCMIYEAFIDKTFPGYRDGYADLITDWILTEWKDNNLVDGWQKADAIVKKFLMPTLYTIKPLHDGLCVCPKCGHKFKE